MCHRPVSDAAKAGKVSTEGWWGAAAAARCVKLLTNIRIFLFNLGGGGGLCWPHMCRLKTETVKMQSQATVLTVPNPGGGVFHLVSVDFYGPCPAQLQRFSDPAKKISTSRTIQKVQRPSQHTDWSFLTVCFDNGRVEMSATIVDPPSTIRSRNGLIEISQIKQVHD